MNVVVIAMLSGVIVLGGCTQNESRRAQQPAATVIEPELPSGAELPPGVKAKALPPSLEMKDGDFQTQYPNSAPVSPGAPLPTIRIEDPSTMAGTGPATSNIPAGTLSVQASQVVQPAEVSPSGVTARTGVFNPIPAPTGNNDGAQTTPRGQEQRFRPMPSPTGPQSVTSPTGTQSVTGPSGTQSVTSPSDVTQTQTTPRGQEQRFRPMPSPTGVVPSKPDADADDVASAGTGATTLRGQEQRFRPMPSATGSTTQVSSNQTIVIVAATGATGATGVTGQSVRPQVAATASTSAQQSEFKTVKIEETKAYQDFLAPLFRKLRSLHASTADRLEKKLKDTALKSVDSSMQDAWQKNKSELLIANFQLPVDSEFKLIHLKNAILIPASDLAASEKAARMILEGILLRLAYDSATQKDHQFMATVTGLSHSIAQNLLSARDRLNSRLVYEYLRYAQISVNDWKFEEVDGIAAATEVLRLANRKFSLTSAKPETAFKIAETNLDVRDPENCKINIIYQGIEKGTQVRVTEPEWRDFEFRFDSQRAEKYPLRPSMAGDKYLDMELIQKNDDKSSLRLTLRFLIIRSGEKSERRADHLVLERLPEKGAAEKMLMCRLIADESAAPTRREEELTAGTGVTATTGATAATGTVRGQEQRFRPATAATGVTTQTKVTAPTGTVRGQEQRFRPATASTSVATQAKATAPTGTVRGQEQRFRPMPAATGPTGKTQK